MSSVPFMDGDKTLIPDFFNPRDLRMWWVNLKSLSSHVDSYKIQPWLVVTNLIAHRLLHLGENHRNKLFSKVSS